MQSPRNLAVTLTRFGREGLFVPLLPSGTACPTRLGTARPRGIGLLVLILLVGCAHAPFFSEAAYTQAISLKVESLALMEQATEPFAEHQDEVRTLQLDLAKASEFARGRPQNAISARQWQILLDPERDLLGGFLARWESMGNLSRAYIDEAKVLISDAFDTISGLESRRIKPDEVQ